MKTLTLVVMFAAGLAAGAAAAPPEDALPPASAVLARFAEAVGGPDAFAALDRRHYRGTIVQDLSWTDPQHQETPFRAEADAAGFVRFAEAAAWGALPDTNATSLSAKVRWLLHPCFALRVEEFFPDLSVVSREIRAGRPVLVLEPRGLEPAHDALSFDEESGLLTRVGYYLDLADWREEDGVLVPHRWAFSRKGGHTTYVIEEAAAGPAPRD